MDERAVGGLVQHRRLGFGLWLGGGWLGGGWLGGGWLGGGWLGGGWLGGGTALASGLAVLLGHRRWSLVWNAFVRLECVG